MKGLCLDKRNACNWNSGPGSAGDRRGADDVAFTRILVDWIVDPQAVGGHPDHVFAMGFSNGASMVPPQPSAQQESVSSLCGTQPAGFQAVVELLCRVAATSLRMYV